LTDRERLEKAEARALVHNFIANKQSKEWLAKAIAVSKKVYGAGSEDRIKAYMRQLWKDEVIS
jgi:hypothetical protein